MERLGKNINGYFGERIEIQAVLRDIQTAALERGWSSEIFLEEGEWKWVALTRRASCFTDPVSRIYISSGIHGDEPAGPLAIRQLLRENRWPSNLDLWLCPCLNPTGFALNRRENQDGFDLNRQYLHPTSREVAAHIAWLERQPAFDLCLCLHEDWEAHGFYLYELNPDQRPSLAEAIVQQVAKICPVDPSSTIEGRPADGGIIRPGVDPRSRPDWPEAFYLLTHKTRLSYTMEAPSDYPLSARVAALVTGVRTATGEAGRAGGAGKA
jgi:Succinylglutamate desuccinylase / Aspartoacylase family